MIFRKKISKIGIYIWALKALFFYRHHGCLQIRFIEAECEEELQQKIVARLKNLLDAKGSIFLAIPAKEVIRTRCLMSNEFNLSDIEFLLTKKKREYFVYAKDLPIIYDFIISNKSKDQSQEVIIFSQTQKFINRYLNLFLSFKKSVVVIDLDNLAFVRTISYLREIKPSTKKYLLLYQKSEEIRLILFNHATILDEFLCTNWLDTEKELNQLIATDVKETLELIYLENLISSKEYLNKFNHYPLQIFKINNIYKKLKIEINNLNQELFYEILVAMGLILRKI